MKTASSLATAILVILATVMTLSLINSTLRQSSDKMRQGVQSVDAKLVSLKEALTDMDRRQYELLVEKQQLLNEIAELRAELESRPTSIRQLVVSAEHVDPDAAAPVAQSGTSIPVRVDAGVKGVRPGGVAVSRDLYESGWNIGRKVYVDGVGVYEIFDVIAAKQRRKVQILVDSKERAAKFGIQSRKVTLLE